MLFNIEDELPTVSSEARLIKEFNVIITRDRGSKGDVQARKKKQACKELAFVYYISDHKSPYLLYPEHEREKRIIRDLDLQDGWKVDEEIKNAIDKYKELTETLSVRILESSRGAAIKLIQYLDNVDYAAKDGKGNLVYKANDVVKVISQTSDLISGLESLEERIKKEQGAKKSKIRGGEELGNREE